MGKGDKNIRVGESSHRIAGFMSRLEGKPIKHIVGDALVHYATSQIDELFQDRDKKLDQLLLLAKELHEASSCQK